MDRNGDPSGHIGARAQPLFGPSQSLSVQRHSLGQSVSIFNRHTQRQGEAPSDHRQSTPQHILPSLNTNVSIQPGSAFTAINIPQTSRTQTSVLLTPNASPSRSNPSSASSQEIHRHQLPNQQPFPQSSPQEPSLPTRHQWPQHIPNGAIMLKNNHIPIKPMNGGFSEEDGPQRRYFCVYPQTIGRESRLVPTVPLGECSNQNCLKSDGFSSAAVARRHLQLLHFKGENSEFPSQPALLNWVNSRVTPLSYVKKRAMGKRKISTSQRIWVNAHEFPGNNALAAGANQVNSLVENRSPGDTLLLEPNLGVQPNDQLHKRPRFSIARPPPLDTAGALPPLQQSDALCPGVSLPSIQNFIPVFARSSEPETRHRVNLAELHAELHQLKNGRTTPDHDQGSEELSRQSDYPAEQVPADNQFRPRSASIESQPPQAIAVEPISSMKPTGESDEPPTNLPSPLLRSSEGSESRDNELSDTDSDCNQSTDVIESLCAATDLLLNWGRLRTINENYEVIDPRSAVSQPRPPFIRLGWLLLALENDFINDIYSAILTVGKIEAATELGFQIHIMAARLQCDDNAAIPRHDEFCQLLRTWGRYELANAIIDSVLYKKHGEILASNLAPSSVVLDVPMDPLANYIQVSSGFTSLKRTFENKYRDSGSAPASNPFPTGLMSPALSTRGQDIDKVYPGLVDYLEPLLRPKGGHTAPEPSNAEDKQSPVNSPSQSSDTRPSLTPDQNEETMNENPPAEVQSTSMPSAIPSAGINDKLEDDYSPSVAPKSPVTHYEEDNGQARRHHVSAPPLFFAKDDNGQPRINWSRSAPFRHASEDLHRVSTSPAVIPEKGVTDYTRLDLASGTMKVDEDSSISAEDPHSSRSDGLDRMEPSGSHPELSYDQSSVMSMNARDDSPRDQAFLQCDPLADLNENDKNIAAFSSSSDTRSNHNCCSPGLMESIEHDYEDSGSSHPFSPRHPSPTSSNEVDREPRMSTESHAQYYTPLTGLETVGGPSLALESSLQVHVPTPADSKLSSPLLSPVPKQNETQVRVQPYHHQPSGDGNIMRACKQLWDAVVDSAQPNLLPGTFRVSWNCRCGTRLHIDVAQGQEAPALAFAQMACGPSNIESVVMSHSDSLHTASTSTSLQTTSVSHDNKASLATNATITRNEDPSDSDSTSSDPRSAEKHVLLCIKKGNGHVELKNVDLSDVTNDADCFSKIRAAYNQTSRGRFSLNRISKSRKMQYIKFKLLRNEKLGDCVEQLQSNSVPTQEAIQNGEYALQTTLPGPDNFHIPPDIFMHALLNPGEHLGPIAADMIPRKLGSQLAWDDATHSIYYPPVGWGIYIE